MNIILIGLRGCGKSMLGKMISKKLGKDFLDVDKEIEKIEKKKIEKIIKLKGWEYFRALESQVAQKASSLENTIIATGGGTILNSEDKKALKSSGKVIYLYRKPDDCIKFIQNDPNRPPLTNHESIEEEMRELYRERNGIYCQAANKLFHRTEDLEKDAAELISFLSES